MLSAVILAPVALAIVWFGDGLWTTLITLAAAGLACEWVQLCGSRVRALPGIAVPLSMIAVGAVAAGQADAAALLVLLAAFAITWILAACLPAARAGRSSGPAAERLSGHAAERFSGPAAERPFSLVAERPSSLAAGVVYIGIACVAMIWLRSDAAAGRPNILFLLLVVWASDVGAYMAGRLLGGPRLAPAISPGKTWAGALGGLLAAVAMGCGVAVAAMHAEEAGGWFWRVALVAGSLGVMSQLGDLLESLLKRRFGVKDSGRLIPGHGGLLDRLDGFLTAAPVAALLALAVGPGVVLWG